MILSSSSSPSSAKRAHAELIGAADGVARLDRMHEVQVRVGDRRRVLDLGQRGDVEMADAGAVQRADQEDGAVRLVGVGDVAGELVEKPARRAPCCMRSQATHRPLGPGLVDQRRCRGELLHRIGPPPPAGEHGQLLEAETAELERALHLGSASPPVKSFLMTWGRGDGRLSAPPARAASCSAELMARENCDPSTLPKHLRGQLQS